MENNTFYRPLVSMNLQFFAGEKTEKPTPKKLEEARKKGQVPKSIEVNSAFLLLVMFGTLFFMSGYIGENILSILKKTFTEYILWEFSFDNLKVMLFELTIQSVFIVAPLLGMAFLTAFLANYLQIGFLFTTEPLMMKLEKLNPIEGMKKIFSMRSVVELAKNIIKVIAVGGLALSIIWGRKSELMDLSQTSTIGALSFIGEISMELGFSIGLLIVFLGLLDYMYQKFEHEKGLKMSKQDIKEEFKKTEGDPLIKGKIKQKQREIVMNRMMQDIPKADVIVTNPTHFAIAIQYDSSSMAAPIVIAKGKDYIALKIKEIAKEHDIVVMENKPLARTLYKEVEIGETVPPDLFKAVAEVLSYVYKLKGKK